VQNDPRPSELDRRATYSLHGWARDNSYFAATVTFRLADAAIEKRPTGRRLAGSGGPGSYRALVARLLHIVTHPEVQVDPWVPVPEWGLSNDGLRRAAGLLVLPWAQQLAHVFSSGERKAVQTAELLAAAGGLSVVVDEALGENDRSATGYLPPAEFEAVADLFFREPTRTVRGWESARAAQQRMVTAVDRCLARAATGDVAVVAQGAVGTLLWCNLAEEPIDRRHDQPGQGSWYSVDLLTMRPLSAWRRLQAPMLRSPADP